MILLLPKELQNPGRKGNCAIDHVFKLHWLASCLLLVAAVSCSNESSDALHLFRENNHAAKYYSIRESNVGLYEKEAIYAIQQKIYLLEHIKRRLETNGNVLEYGTKRIQFETLMLDAARSDVKEIIGMLSDGDRLIEYEFNDGSYAEEGALILSKDGKIKEKIVTAKDVK